MKNSNIDNKSSSPRHRISKRLNLQIIIYASFIYYTRILDKNKKANKIARSYSGLAQVTVFYMPPILKGAI